MRLALVAVLIFVSASVAKAEDDPRRMLVIHVGNPLYLDALTSRALDGTERVRDASSRLAAALRIPSAKTNDQLFILSDTLAAPAARIPTRFAILDAVRAFAATSRAQDRVILYFAGHAFEKDGKAYFAPIEGDGSDPESLVAVSEIYDILKSSKATQTVVVWDVCRRNPVRPRVRPTSGPMTEALAKSLAAAPANVQVVLSCSPGEYALEYAEPKGDARLYAGSALVDALRQAIEDQGTVAKPNPNDALPIVSVFPEVVKYVASAAKAYGVKQTPRLVGNAPKQPTPFDSNAANAARIEFPVTTSTADAKSIFDELALPPFALGTDADVPIALPYSAAALKAYLPDATIEEIQKNADKYPLRIAVLRALQAIRETSTASDPKAVRLPTRLNAPITEKTKKLVLDAQGPVALALAKLEGELELLLRVGEVRDKETKRWQAHYDYALAQLQLRLAMLNEYNLLLGNVRTESLPELVGGVGGWRIEHSEKMHSKKDIRELATTAVDGFKALAAKNKGTPWEVLAKRALLTPPGLKWEPVPGK